MGPRSPFDEDLYRFRCKKNVDNSFCNMMEPIGEVLFTTLEVEDNGVCVSARLILG